MPLGSQCDVTDSPQLSFQLCPQPVDAAILGMATYADHHLVAFALESHDSTEKRLMPAVNIYYVSREGKCVVLQKRGQSGACKVVLLWFLESGC